MSKNFFESQNMLALRARIQTGYSLRERRFFGIFIFPKPKYLFIHLREAFPQTKET